MASPDITPLVSWTMPKPRLGYQRFWRWRGWRIRYTYLRSSQPLDPDRHPPMLFLHGFGACFGHWRENLAPLSEAYPVYALDLLGFGESSKAKAPYNPGLWAELVAEFWQTFIQRPMVLVGNSLGSSVAIAVADQYPDQIKALVLLTLPDASVLQTRPPQPAPIPGLDRLGQYLGKGLSALVSSPLVVNPLFYWARSPQVLTSALKNAYVNPERVDQELQQMIRTPTLDPQAVHALRWMTKGMGQTTAALKARTILPRLQVPILLIWGQNDRLVPPSLAPRCQALNPTHIELMVLDKAGHCPQDDCGDRLNQILRNWLAKIP